MRIVNGLVHRLRVILSPESYARDVEREIRFHLELDSMHRRNAGMSQSNADSAARRQFGNVTYTREEVRGMSAQHTVDRLRQNLRFAIRGLAHSPGFTIGVVLTLGLGLGVNAAMFDFLDRVFVRPPAAVSKPAEVRRLYIEADRAGARDVWSDFRYPHIRAMAHAVDTSFKFGIYPHNAIGNSIEGGSIGPGPLPRERW